ncbi:MAG: ARPP-1 family domain-containing protein, partial [Candidatus Kariarchaeaceae archaeon]
MGQIQELLQGIKWDKSVSYGPYTVVPIIGDLGHESIKVEIVTDETEGVNVTELEKENVNRVNIKSKYKKPLLILNGQIFEGGKQTRSSIRPFIIKSGRNSEIPVNCVEQGR